MSFPLTDFISLSPDVIARFDEKQRHLFVSPSIEKFTGMKPEVFVGKTNEELGMAPENCERWREVIDRVFRTGQIHEMFFTYSQGFEKEKSPADFSNSWFFHLVAFPETTENSRVESVVCVSRNLNQLFDQEKVLKEIREEMNLAKERAVFSAVKNALFQLSEGISHEINNPLAVLKGRLTQTMREFQKASLKLPHIENYLNTIDKQALRIQTVVQSLSFFSGKRIVQNRDLFSLLEVTERALQLCGESLKERGIQLKVQIPEHLTSFGESGSIAQVLFALIRNSAEAIENLPEKWIQIQAVEKDHFAVLSIIDSGPGIPRDIAEKIFVPFFSTKALNKSQGLGLSFALRIVRDHHGDIEYCSESKHTRFDVKLPLRPDHSFKLIP